MNDMPGWGPDPGTPVPPPPTPPTAPMTPGAPTVPGAPVYGAPPVAPPPAQYQGQYQGQAPGYGQMAGPYGAPPYAMVTPTPPGKGLQVASLVLGIVSLIIFLSWICLICGILAIILGAIGRSKAKQAGAPTGLGTAGIICGSIGVVLVIGLIVLAIVYVSSYRGVYFG